MKSRWLSERSTVELAPRSVQWDRFQALEAGVFPSIGVPESHADSAVPPPSVVSATGPVAP